MDSRIRNFEPFLNCRSGEVNKVGIWGTGGIGKTTFAEEVFKRIRGEFQASHFVYRVREECETEDGLTRLRKELDEKLLNKKASMKALIVLDDVDNATQIEALVGQVGSGSKILITTRDENLLKDSGVRDVHEVEKLNDKEGLQLFCAKAFEGKHYPHRFYEELSKEFVNYADGLPLALEVLGNYLRLHKSEKEWKGELKRLRETPHEGITKVLQFSYDALNYQAKETFLDIACFFKGEDESRLIKIFESCDFHPDSSLSVLVARSLIFVTGGKVWMHDLIQQMGSEIVRKDHISDPGMHSRLWRDRDALRVLQENMVWHID
ncbi:TMV resistance protein N-like [Morus notabilis]|uniref:TMV resistance protein N-like n=1 Tax=Morus notabilis TaxID=981085 RepID=UPI000CED7730|nr:TMV resistance protein N-like [Morus notabilis]